MTSTVGSHDDFAPVVFVNGLFQRADSWNGIKATLDNYTDTHSYDLRNQGTNIHNGSSLPVDCHAQDLLTVLDDRHLEAVTLVGHSYGARIALDFAIRHPARVSRLVMIGLSSPDLASRYQMIFRSWRDALPAPEGTNWELFSEVVSPWVFSAGFLASERDLPRNYARNLARSHTSHGLRLNISQLIESYDPQNMAHWSGARVDCPALIINGAEDYLTPPSAISSVLALLPRATLKMLPKCGHAVMAEASTAFESATTQFLLH